MHFKRKIALKLVSMLYWHLTLISRRNWKCIAAITTNWVAGLPGLERGWSNTVQCFLRMGLKLARKGVQPGSCRREHSRYGTGAGWKTRGRWELFDIRIKRMKDRDRRNNRKKKKMQLSEQIHWVKDLCREYEIRKWPPGCELGQGIGENLQIWSAKVWRFNELKKADGSVWEQEGRTRSGRRWMKVGVR